MILHIHSAILLFDQPTAITFPFYHTFVLINEWNKLPNVCVNASSVNMFKNRIDRYLIRVGYT